MISGKWQQLLEITGFTRASTDELWLANCYFDSHRACNNVASSRRMLFISKALLILAEHRSRTHLALGKDAPEPRAVEPPEQGRVVAIPQVGGLHHRYQRRAA
jgi:hypothetical protein